MVTGGERPFVSQILSKGQTGVIDSGYLSHHDFDQLQDDEKHFVCRIKAITMRTVLQENVVEAESHIFSMMPWSFAGFPARIRLLGRSVLWDTRYAATDSHDLTAKQIAIVYKLKWTIESFSNGGKSI
jgi:hypothetical protein